MKLVLLWLHAGEEAEFVPLADEAVDVVPPVLRAEATRPPAVPILSRQTQDPLEKYGTCNMFLTKPQQILCEKHFCSVSLRSSHR